ncbi:ABC transporter substrate-binding protein [Microbacterium sp. 179-I 3D3 NHS]|uniref:ABC transporter substrate-binding protein n=1 Tax=Microbacterium sp. 179-I 3D3 NHS TaxID=3142382 RepID=UPI0039A1B9E3
MHKRTVIGAGLAAAALMLTGCMGGATPPDEEPASQPGTLTVWWAKGNTDAEDEAVKAIVDAWAEETGNKVELVLMLNEDFPTKLSAAVQAGRGPDIAYSPAADAQLFPTLAADGVLADVSQIVDAIREDLLPVGIDSSPKGENGEIYSVPIQLQPFDVFYRTDLLEKAGMDTEPPSDWEGYWDFWMSAQDELRAQGDAVHGIGLPVSTVAQDGDNFIMWLFAAFGASPELENTLENAEAIGKAYAFLKDLYDRDYMPSAAINWAGPDNNTELERGGLVMTPNPTLSVATGALVSNPEYFDKLAVAPWPTGPDGDVVPLPLKTTSAVILEQSKNPELAEELLTYFIQPENLQTYMETHNGMFVPVNRAQWEDPFWSESSFHQIVKDEVTTGKIVPWPYAYNRKFADVFNEALFTRPAGEVLLGAVEPDAAAQAFLDQVEALVK